MKGSGSTVSGNRTLSSAKAAKQDEFYTRLSDIANELKHYKEHLRGKVVLCNCDDPYESNFFQYFALNFNTVGLKKLICTSYDGSPIVGGQLPLMVMEGLKPYGRKEPYLVEINEVPDFNHDGAINREDVEHLLKHNKNASRPLKQGFDFRSCECVEVLKKADIVVTNPPFSLFREYVTQRRRATRRCVEGRPGWNRATVSARPSVLLIYGTNRMKTLTNQDKSAADRMIHVRSTDHLQVPLCVAVPARNGTIQDFIAGRIALEVERRALLIPKVKQLA